MKTISRPLTDEQKVKLNSYVSWDTGMYVWGAALVIVLLFITGSLAHFIHSRLARWFPGISHFSWWLAPTIVFVLLALWKAWTSGRGFRQKVREDLAGGQVAVHCVNAVDAIEVQAKEDKRRSFYIKTDEGETFLLTGQYLYHYTRKGFPWSSFEILESPASKIFFGLKKTGDRLNPSFTRKPFTWDEWKSFRACHALLATKFLSMSSANASQ